MSKSFKRPVLGKKFDIAKVHKLRRILVVNKLMNYCVESSRGEIRVKTKMYFVVLFGQLF